MQTQSAVATKRTVPLLDLKAQLGPMREEILAAMTGVMDSQKCILGDAVQHLEQQLAPYCGARHAIGCASGSDALFLALLGLDVGPGDEVLTVPYSFFATAGAIVRAGARPVFVDVEPDTFNMDMSQVAAALDRHPKVKAIIPVSLYGGVADMDALNALAAPRNIPVIEDAAQSIGAEYKGRRSGGLSTVACFSFYPSKNLGAMGDGGLLTTNDDALAARLKALRVHGSAKKYYHEMVGVNSRLDALQAAILAVKFKYLDSWSDGRGRNANLYRKLLAERRVPVIAPEPAAYQNRHVWNQFVIRCSRDRDPLQQYLQENGIGTEIYYPLSLHQQPCFADLGYAAGSFPVSEDLARTTLALPIYAELKPDDIEYVVEKIHGFYA